MSRKPALPSRDSIRGGGNSTQLEHKVIQLEQKIGALEEQNAALRTARQGSISGSEIEACSRFLQHENRYVNRHLRTCDDFYLKPLKEHIRRGQPIMSQEDIGVIFRNFDVLYAVHQKLYKDMIQVAISTPLGLPKEIGRFMNEYVPFFKLYIDFLNRRDEAMTRLKDLYKDQRFVEWHKIQEPCAGHSLRHFLERPTKRLQEYLGDLMATYSSFVNKECQSAKSLFQTAQNLKETLDRIAHNLKVSRGQKNLIALASRYGLSRLQTNSRWVVLKAECQSLFNHRWKDVEFIICNDIVFTAKESGIIYGGLKWALSMKGLIVFEALAEKKETQELKKFLNKHKPVHYFFIRNWESDSETYVVSFQDEETRDNCFTEITARIEEQRLSQFQCNPHGLNKRLRGKKTLEKEKEEYVQVDVQSASSPNLFGSLNSNSAPPTRLPPQPQPTLIHRQTKDSELSEAAGIPLPSQPQTRSSPPKRPKPKPKPKSVPPTKTPPRAPPPAKRDMGGSTLPLARPGPPLVHPNPSPPPAPKRKSTPVQKRSPLPPQRTSNRFVEPPQRPESSQPSWVKKSPLPPKRKQNSTTPPPRPKISGGAPPPFKAPPPQPDDMKEEEVSSDPPSNPKKAVGPPRPNFLASLKNNKVQLKKTATRKKKSVNEPQNDLTALMEQSRQQFRQCMNVSSDEEDSSFDWD